MKLKLEDFKRSEEKPALELYNDGIKAEATRVWYTNKLRYLLCHTFQDILDGSFEERCQQLVDRTRKDPEWTIDLFLNFMELCKKRTSLPKEHPEYLNPSSISNYVKPVKKLFRMNGIDISWARIHASIPELYDREKVRGYEREEICKILKTTSNPTYRAVVLVASSSGIRAGAFDFTWGDMMPIYRKDGQLKLKADDAESIEVVCVAVLIYGGSPSAYLAFITPEAYSAVLEHKKKWMQEAGREPLPNEPVFKNRCNPTKPLSPNVMREQINRILVKSGLRKIGKRRHEVPTMNGFRKFWNKKVKEAKSRDSALASLIRKEYMMGHEGLISMDKHYFQTSVLELAEEYLTVVPELTITDEYRLKTDNTKLKKERDELLELAREAIDERDGAIESLKKQLGKR